MITSGMLSHLFALWESSYAIDNLTCSQTSRGTFEEVLQPDVSSSLKFKLQLFVNVVPVLKIILLTLCHIDINNSQNWGWSKRVSSSRCDHKKSSPGSLSCTKKPSSSSPINLSQSFNWLSFTFRAQLIISICLFLTFYLLTAVFSSSIYTKENKNIKICKNAKVICF